MDYSQIACIIMASGLGSRFGSNKLMATFNRGPLIENALVLTAAFPNRLVVTRHKEVQDLCQKQQIPALLHQEPGQNDTVRLGVGALHKARPLGYLFCVGDQPLLKAASLTALCQSFLAQPDYIYRCSFKGRPGNPIIFPAKYAAELMQLPMDKGGSYLAKKYPEQVRLIPVQESFELYDIDTLEDLDHLSLFVLR